VRGTSLFVVCVAVHVLNVCAQIDVGLFSDQQCVVPLTPAALLFNSVQVWVVAVVLAACSHHLLVHWCALPCGEQSLHSFLSKHRQQGGGSESVFTRAVCPPV